VVRRAEAELLAPDEEMPIDLRVGLLLYRFVLSDCCMGGKARRAEAELLAPDEEMPIDLRVGGMCA